MKVSEKYVFVFRSISKKSCILLLLVFLVGGCSDSKDSSGSCMTRLDESKFQEVAENTACTDYERGSGYFGWAGLSFTAFTKTGGTDNMSLTLGITDNLSGATDYTSGTRDKITKGLCLVGSDELISSTTSPRCSGTTNEIRSQTRDEGYKELTMFGLIGDLIYMIYGVMDRNHNGNISEINDWDNQSDTDAYSAMTLDSSISSASGTDVLGLVAGFSPTSTNPFDPTPTFELVTTDNVSYIASNEWYLNPDSTSLVSAPKCVEYTDNFTVVPSSGTCPDESTISYVRPILKMDNLTDLSGGGDLTSKITFLSQLTATSGFLDTEFGEIGLSENNTLRTSLSSVLSLIDNGAATYDNSTEGSCISLTGNPVAYVYNLEAGLLQNPADNSTSVNSTSLRQKNLFWIGAYMEGSTSELNLWLMYQGLNPTGVGTHSSSKTYAMENARIIYAMDNTSSNYTDYYHEAEISLKSTINNMTSLGVTVPSAGDGKVEFLELICTTGMSE